MTSGKPSGSPTVGGLRILLVVDWSRAFTIICSARTAAGVPVRFSSAGRLGTALALDATVDPIGGPGGGGGYFGAVCTVGVGGGFPTAEDLGEVIGGVLMADFGSKTVAKRF